MIENFINRFFAFNTCGIHFVLVPVAGLNTAVVKNKKLIMQCLINRPKSINGEWHII